MNVEKKPTLWGRIRQFWGRLEVKDRILLAMMAILMLQSGVTLLHIVPDMASNDSVDIVVRTTTASIFGYFLGATFLKNKEDAPSQQELRRQHQQLILVGTLGMTSLTLFLLGRNLAFVTDSDYSTMAQLRDFVSGSVGMLIGYSPNQ